MGKGVVPAGNRSTGRWTIARIGAAAGGKRSSTSWKWTIARIGAAAGGKRSSTSWKQEHR